MNKNKIKLNELHYLFIIDILKIYIYILTHFTKIGSEK